MKGRVRPPPGLEPEGNVELEDMVPGQSEASLNRIYCFKMAMIDLLKWIMKHLKRLENRQERVQGLIQMHLLLNEANENLGCASRDCRSDSCL